MSFVSHIFSSIYCIDSNSNRITTYISNNKNVYSFGFSQYYSHGDEEENILKPKQIKGLSNIKMISSGTVHTLCLNYDGNVYSYGSNLKGRLGVNKDANILVKTTIPQKINLSFISQIYCGSDFSICVSEERLIYSFGRNDKGQLGLGNILDSSSPQLIPNLTNIEFAICGGYHTICKTFDNLYYSWGYNDCGQLGTKTETETNFSDKPIKHLNWIDNIASIKCGLFHSLLLTFDGQVYSFGDNIYAQLGINDKETKKVYHPILIEDLPQIQRIECGNDHSLCIDIDNKLWVFGANSFGQLALGDTKDRYKPTLNDNLIDIIDISSGGNHTFVKTSDNRIFAFGYNNKQQLGKKTLKEHQKIPIQVFKKVKDSWYSPIRKSKQKSARK